MTRDEIARQYGINEDGTILALGKFEAEMCYAPYFYDKIMEGCADEEHDDDGTLMSYFNITDEDIEQFPELDGIERVRCYEDDQGFFYCMEAGEDEMAMDTDEDEAE